MCQPKNAGKKLMAQWHVHTKELQGAVCHVPICVPGWIGTFAGTLENANCAIQPVPEGLN